tara:strand:+ start:2866 stop:3597 length:732 start_codon:yes stop_codon:yes gene_type:complete
MSDHLIFLFILIPFISMLFSSVGHGGASGYLALMSLFLFPVIEMKSTALLLNIFVSGIAFYNYYRFKYFNKKLFFSFAIGSIPAAFIGGNLIIDVEIYKNILGFFLLFAAAKFLYNHDDIKIKKRINYFISLIFGTLIGFFSGLIGIGGGIILTPLILLLKWGNVKTAAGVSSLFIFFNSISGFLGLIFLEIHPSNNSFLLLILAIIGGLIGSYYGSRKWNNQILKYLLAIVLFIASFKLIFI